MEILVITGGIGSGKSEVCRLLREIYDAAVYSADDRVKSLYDEHPTLLNDIESLCGESLRNEHGRFVPSLLAQKIFADKELLTNVEALVFPALLEDFSRWKEDYEEHEFVVFESATILEKDWFKGFGDKVILVDAPYEIRLERACRRDSASAQAITSRMKNQKLMNMVSSGEVVPDVDMILDNSAGPEELRAATIAAINELYSKFNDNK